MDTPVTIAIRYLYTRISCNPFKFDYACQNVTCDLPFTHCDSGMCVCDDGYIASNSTSFDYQNFADGCTPVNPPGCDSKLEMPKLDL
jgi:hypothetical protein